ncbi:MAG: hypothetical protein HRT95_05780 [Moritella sp.]|uniref:hypothetical protein n=1 Tax=Moritella sp. TaxID=78556 RepID=UPI001E0755E6|nr:hypothetical protein [Moritella sp.]NQZ49701.1 hypothetical protein [Moritella sp.]
MTIVKLTDFSDDVILEEIGSCGYTKKLVIKAITAIKETKIKFNHKTGFTTNNEGFLSSYTSYEQQPIEHTISNEFKPWIMNFCSKATRGLVG